MRWTCGRCCILELRGSNFPALPEQWEMPAKAGLASRLDTGDSGFKGFDGLERLFKETWRDPSLDIMRL